MYYILYLEALSGGLHGSFQSINQSTPGLSPSLHTEPLPPN